MRLLADPEERIVLEVSALFEPGDLLQENFGVDHDAVSNHAEFVRMKGPGGDEMDNGFFSADDERVAGVIAPLKADYDIRVLGKEIDDLAFTLVSPLGPDDSDVGH